MKKKDGLVENKKKSASIAFPLKDYVLHLSANFFSIEENRLEKLSGI